MLRDPLHSRFLDTGSRERRLAYFAETPEILPPEPAAPPPEPVSNRGEMLRKQADIIDQLENAGESYKDILSRAVEQYMEDGEMQLEEAQGLALQVDGVLARLNSSLRVPEELQNTESMLLLAQNAGLISSEALGAVSRRYEGAPGGRSERRYARGAVRTGYDRERKMWYKEQHNGSAWQTIEEKSIEQCRQEGLMAARDRGWGPLAGVPDTQVQLRAQELAQQPSQWAAYQRSHPGAAQGYGGIEGYVKQYGIWLANEYPENSNGYSRTEKMNQFRRSCYRLRRAGAPMPSFEGEARPTSFVGYTPEQYAEAQRYGVLRPNSFVSETTRSAGVGLPYGAEITGGTRSGGGGGETFHMEAQRMAHSELDAIPYDYDWQLHVPITQQTRILHESLRKDWPRLSAQERRHRINQLESYRAVMKKIQEQNERTDHNMNPPLWQRTFEIPPIMGFQQFAITIKIPTRDPARPRVITYYPRAGLYKTTQEAYWAKKAGIEWGGRMYVNDQAQEVTLYIKKPGTYLVNGEQITIRGQMLAKRRQQVVDLKEMAQKLEDTDPLKPLVMQLDVKTDREGTVAIVMPEGATKQLSYIAGRTDANTWAIAPSMETQEAAYEVFQNPDDVYEAIRETLSHKLAPKETPLDAPTETPLAALDPVPVPPPTEAPGASAEHESGTATESTEATAERGITPENATEEQPKSVEHPTPLRTWPPPLDVLSESESPFAQGMENIRRAEKNDEARRDAGGVWKDSNDPRWGERKGYWQYPEGIQRGADDPPPGWVLPESEPVQNVLPPSIQETPVSERAMEFVSTLKQAIRQIDLQKGDGSNESHVQRMNEIAPQMLAYAQSTENLSDRLLIAEAFISLQLLGFGGYTERGRELLRENVAQHRHFPSAMALTVGTTPEEQRQMLDNAKTLIRSQEDQKIWEEADAQLREIEQSRARERAEKERIKEEDRRMTEIVNQQIQQTGLEVKYNSQSGALILDQGNGTLVLEGEQAKNWWPEEELRAEGIEIKYIAGNVEIKDAEKVTFPATLKHIGGRLRLNGVQEPIQFPQQMLIDDGVDIVNIEKPKMDAVLQAMDAAKVESTNANMRDIILHMRIQKDAYTKDALREWGEKYESFWIEEDEELK